MNDTRKKKVMQEPEMEIITIQCADVIAASGDIPMVTTVMRSTKDDRTQFGISGFFNSENWYTNKQN